MNIQSAKSFLGQSAYVTAIRVSVQAAQFGLFAFWTYRVGLAESGVFSLNLNAALLIGGLGGASMPSLYGRLVGPRRDDIAFCRAVLLQLMTLSGLLVALLLAVMISARELLEFELYVLFVVLAFQMAWRDLVAEHLNMQKRYFAAFGGERLVVGLVLLPVFAVVVLLADWSYAYPIAFFAANVSGIAFLLVLSLRGPSGGSLRETAVGSWPLLRTEAPNALRLGANNLVNTFSFPLLILIAGAFLPSADIGAISVAHMAAAAVLYAQPAFVNRLTPFMYDQAASPDRRQLWRDSIDRLALVSLPVLFGGIVAIWAVLDFVIDTGELGTIVLLGVIIGAGYVCRLVGTVNQLWLIHVQRLTTLWKPSCALLGLGVILLVLIADHLGPARFVLVFALLEWLRASVFSALARTLEKP